MAKSKKTQEDLDNEKFLSGNQKKALRNYLNLYKQIAFIQQHYPSLLVKV